MKRHKLWAALWVLTLCLTLCACGGPAEAPGESPSAPESAAPGATSTDAAIQEYLTAITPETAELKGVCGPSMVWYYQDNVLLIKGTGEMTTPSWQDYDSDNIPWEQRLKHRVYLVILDEGITSVADRAFGKDYDEYDLVRAIIPGSVAQIGDYAFANCPNLTDVTLTSGVAEIGDCAFWSSRNLTDITIPSSVTEIGDRAFNYVIYAENEDEKIYSVTIHGEAGSYAETYANEHGIPFEAE